jgi:hypothetical protein
MVTAAACSHWLRRSISPFSNSTTALTSFCSSLCILCHPRRKHESTQRIPPTLHRILCINKHFKAFLLKPFDLKVARNMVNSKEAGQATTIGTCSFLRMSDVAGAWWDDISSGAATGARTTCCMVPKSCGRIGISRERPPM